MQLVASYRNTMGNARFKLVKDNPQPEPINLMEVRRHRLEAECEAIRRERMMEERRLAALRVEANASISLANAALRMLHEQWAIEERRQRAEGQGRNGLLVSKPMTIEEVVRRICKALGVRESEVMANRRTREATFARHAIFYWCFRRTSKPSTVIGRHIGNRDHSTALSAKESYVDKRAKMGRTLRRVR